MKLQIIEVPDYILAVSDEKIKEGDLCVYNKNHNSRNSDWELIRCSVIEREEMHPHSNGKLLLWMIKITAYQPKGNAPELDLPLLPEMVVEDDVDLKLQHRNFSKQVKNPYLTEEKEYQIWERAYIEGFEECYKAATKTYTEDDLRKAILLTRGSDTPMEELIQSIKQPTPKWFVAEIETVCYCGHTITCDCGPVENKEFIQKVKTAVINDKTYLVGTYLYE